MVGTQDCEAVERAARALAGLTTDEPWPTNAALGGGPTGTRDDEYRAAMIDQADAVLAAAGWDELVAERDRLRAGIEAFGQDLALYADLEAACMAERSPSTLADKVQDIMADRLRALAGSGEQPGANSKPAPSSAKAGRNRPAPVVPALGLTVVDGPTGREGEQ